MNQIRRVEDCRLFDNNEKNSASAPVKNFSAGEQGSIAHLQNLPNYSEHGSVLRGRGDWEPGLSLGKPVVGRTITTYWWS